MKCTKPTCTNEATKALKVIFSGEPADVRITAYIALPVCDEIHMPDAEVAEFIKLNWAMLTQCLIQLKNFLPDPSKVVCEWRPWQEADEFWKREA
jgi:hypothetical protein